MINSRNIRVKIERAYARDRKVADDDMLLLAEVWGESGWDNSKSLIDNLRNMPSPETIRRTRQKMVEEGAICPSLTASERRYKNFKCIRKELGYELF